jgi:small-conductance mechanosensitive channel
MTTSENAVLAAWITGLLPFFTTLISFAVYALICMDKKAERLGQEIQDCIKKIEQANKEVNAINKDTESSDAEKVLLDNLTDYIGEIQHSINEFIANKGVHLKQIKEEQRQEFDTAQKAVEKKIWTDFREFYNRGMRRLDPIRKGEPEEWKKLTQKWIDICQEMRDKIATEMSSSWDTGQSYASMLIATPQQKNKKGV